MVDEAGVARRGVGGLLDGDRRGHLERELHRFRLRDERLAVADLQPAVVAHDLELPVERRRQPQRHLGDAAEQPRDQAAGVAAVP